MMYVGLAVYSSVQYACFLVLRHLLCQRSWAGIYKVISVNKLSQYCCSHLFHALSGLSADDAVNDSAANVDFIQSFSKLRDVSLLS